MLAILISGALSASMIFTQPKDTSKTAFDIKYSDKGKDKSLTGGEGFYVAIREYDEYYDRMPLKFIKWGKDLITDNYKASIEKKDDPDQKSIRISITVTNFKNGWLFYDLGVFADANFETDEDRVMKAINDRALKFYFSGTEADTPTLFINGTNFPKVKSIYLGELPGSADIDPSFYPFFNNSGTSTKKGSDSVFAFSWQYRYARAYETDTLGFIASPSNTYSMEPFVYDLSDDYNRQIGNVTLYFEVIDYDNDEVNVEIDLNGTKETHTVKTNTFTPKYSEIISKEITLVAGTRFEYTVKATDKSGHKSEVINNVIWAYGAEPPYMDVDKTYLQEDYNPGDLIYLAGQIDNDEYFVQVKYQFDAGEIITVDKSLFTFWSGKETYSLGIEIPNTLSLGKEHNISIWAEDQYGLKSFITTHPFIYKMPDRPNITRAFLSDERLHIDKDYELVVFGEGADPNPNQTVYVFGRLDNYNELNSTYFKSSDKLETFAYIQIIKANQLKAGRHNITLYVKDDTGERSRSDVVLTFLVYDPKQPLPPSEMGSIIDVSSETIKPGSNALFNLHYVDTYNVQNNMTYNDEGYFAAFRIYEHGHGGKPLNTHIINKNYVTEDNVSISFDTTRDYQTKFTTISFLVFNRNFFEKQIDLGIFTDSDFSNDDNNKIKLRDDKRGITVTNEAKDLHYTILTQDVRGLFGRFSPPVSRYFLKNIPRNGKNPIPVDQIPFFNQTTTKELTNVNAMYGFSWTYTLPPYESVIFAVSFVPHDQIKAPPRVTDNTVIPDDLKAGDTVNISFIIKDHDVDEKIVYYVTFEYDGYTYFNRTKYSFDSNGEDYIFNYTFVLPDNSIYVSYSCVAQDSEADYGFKSNLVKNWIYINHAPRISVNKLNASYNTQSLIKLTGTIRDTDPNSEASVHYRFIDGEDLGVVYRFYAIDVHESLDFTGYISIPPEIYPRDESWGISIWCQDYYGGQSNKVNYTFKLNPYNPPELKNAGLNTRVATIGQELVGYAIIKDQEKDGIEVYVKVDGGSPYPAKPVRRIDNSEKSGEWKAVGFFWQVPNVNPGKHEVLIIARDAEGVPSKTEIRKPLIIQANDY